MEGRKCEGKKQGMKMELRGGNEGKKGGEEESREKGSKQGKERRRVN